MDEHQASSVKVITDRGGALCGLLALLIMHKRSVLGTFVGPVAISLIGWALGFW